MQSGQSYEMLDLSIRRFACRSIRLLHQSSHHPHVLNLFILLLHRPRIEAQYLIDVQQCQLAAIIGLRGQTGAAENRPHSLPERKGGRVISSVLPVEFTVVPLQIRCGGICGWRRIIKGEAHCLTTKNLQNVQWSNAPYNQFLVQIAMISLKRQRPSLAEQNAIVIDSDSEEVQQPQGRKTVKTETVAGSSYSPYQSIPEVPHLKLTIQQMKSDPVELLHQLEIAYREYGAVKLTASQAWNCQFHFPQVDRQVSVRRQTLQDLTQGKPFENVVKSCTLPQFRQRALSFTRGYKFRTNPLGSTLQAQREHEYWRLVTLKDYENKKVTVQYAADLPSSQFGSGFPTVRNPNRKDADFVYEDNCFNLNNTYKADSSLLRVIEDRSENISGITQPWMYVGMMFSTFCWHVEDLFLNSVNYNHIGQTKTWYVVPGKYKEQFDSYVRDHYETAKRRNLLQKINLLIDPLELIRNGIKVYKVQQRPRDYVFTCFKAYHCGFSHGFNAGEAINIVGYDSIEGMKEAYKYYEEQETLNNRKLKSHVICYEWLIYETINRKKCLTPHQQDKMMKEYRRILNREYVHLKGTMDRCGDFAAVEIYERRKNYSHIMCFHCKNYLYLSALKCASCKHVFCERHTEKCECRPKKWILVTREFNEDRDKLRGLFDPNYEPGR